MSASDTSAALHPLGVAEDEPPFDLDTAHRTHGNWLLTFLRRRFSPQDAEDLAQETYARAASTRSPIRNPRAFLARIAINAARDQFRRDAVRPRLVEEGEATALAATPSEAAETLLQKQIILSLPPQLREVFLLRSFTPLTTAETADSAAGEGVPRPVWPSPQGLWLSCRSKGRRPPMAKYEPLQAHLRRQKTDSYEMSFRDIERILTALLPKSAHRPEWWANETAPQSRHVQCKAWLGAGFHAAPDVVKERVRFERRRA